MADVEMLGREQEKTAEVGPPDLLIALRAPISANALAPLISRLSEGLSPFSSTYRYILAIPSDGPLGQPVPPIVGPNQAGNLQVVYYPGNSGNASGIPWLASADSYANVFKFAVEVGARTCTILSRDFHDDSSILTQEQVRLMTEPGLDGGFDLAMPCYSTEPLDGLLNKSILYPLSRALYGRRIRYPLPDEFQISSQFLQKLYTVSSSVSNSRNPRSLWLVSEAANANLKICQVEFGPRPAKHMQGVDLTTALGQLTGSLFIDMENNAAIWQRIRGSQEVPTFGSPGMVSKAADAVDVQRMVNAFQLGLRNLMEIWSIVLPPVTLLELKRLSRTTQEPFRMPDELWVRIVYDFALAHRLRNINRTHLLGSLTPLYLGWAASYVTEAGASGMQAAERRIETLARVYESQKPYLLSRWRWPDRFNP